MKTYHALLCAAASAMMAATPLSGAIASPDKVEADSCLDGMGFVCKDSKAGNQPVSAKKNTSTSTAPQKNAATKKPADEPQDKGCPVKENC